MIPNSRWFPAALQDRAAWFANFAAQFQEIAVSLGFTAADSTAVMNDNLLVQNLLEVQMLLDAYVAAVRQYRVVITEGNIGDPKPAFPPALTYSTPDPTITTGIFERLDNMVRRIRAAPAYSPETGALLGIIPSNPTPPPVADMQPTLKVASMPGSVVQVNFVRGRMNAVAVEMKLDNSETWSEAGRFFKSPAEVVIPQNAENLPRAVMLRARYVEGNNPVGQYSSIVTTSTQPVS